jgi:hypothetical protein
MQQTGIKRRSFRPSSLCMGNISFALLGRLADKRRGDAPRIPNPRGSKMDNFILHFRRLQPGLWECVRAAEYQLSTGRIQVTQGSRFARGTTFMGVDIAKLLDEHYEKESR